MIYTWFKLFEANITNHYSIYSIKLQWSLYGLKQFRHMWYNCLSKYLLKKGYINNSICLCVFIKKLEIKFAIIIVYVDDLTLVGVPKEQQIIWKKKKIEMKDLGETKFYFSLKHFHMDKSINIYWESPKVLPYGQIISIKFSHSSLFTWSENDPFRL